MQGMERTCDCCDHPSVGTAAHASEAAVNAPATRILLPHSSFELFEPAIGVGLSILARARSAE